KQLIHKYGFQFENHIVTTEDGYILQLHRIPYGRKKHNYHKGAPVLIVPGVFESSADWVNTGENSLGFILADRGYDIKKSSGIGDSLSFHDIGLYDLPAFIDYILHVTRQEKLFYIGHSQGTVNFFMLNSEKPEYNKKFRLMVGLGPAAYFSNSKTPIIHFLAAYRNQIQALVDRYLVYEIFPYSPLLATAAQKFCNDNSPFQNVCAGIVYIGVGYSNQFNKSMIPVFLSNAPAGVSYKTLRHATQIYLSGKVPMYDYGAEENFRKYGQPNPPEYNLTKITAPVALYTGTDDIVCVREDVDKTASMMQNVVVNKRIPGFNHVDILWGIDVVDLVFNDILKLMERY
ncbi:hypothetical protein ILUMI_18275, partial [Ignelater luminosus]